MIHKIPRGVRRYVLLPILSIIALIILGMVGKVIWLISVYLYQKINTESVNTFMGQTKKSGNYLYQGIQRNGAILTDLAYGTLILLGLGVLYFLLLWARRRNYLKMTMLKIILLIAVILGWLGWELGTFLYHQMRAQTTALYVGFVLLPLFGAIFVWWAYMQKYGGAWYQNLKSRWFWRENEFFILIGIMALHWDIYTVWPWWWTAHILNDHRIWWIHIILIISAWLIPKGIIPFHHKVGRMLVVVALASMVIIFIWNPQDPGKMGALAEEIERTKATASASVVLPPDADPEVVVIARNKFRNYPFLMTVAIRTSRLRQYELVNGEKHLLLTDLNDGKKHAGVMGIDPENNAAFCRDKGKNLPSKADITTPEGNMDCAILVYHDTSPGRGPDAWHPEKGGVDEFDVVAEKGKWTVPLLLPKAQVTYMFGNYVEYKEDNSLKTPYPISGPGIRRQHEKIASVLEFRVKDDATYDVAIGHFSYAYPPILSVAKN